VGLFVQNVSLRYELEDLRGTNANLTEFKVKTEKMAKDQMEMAMKNLEAAQATSEKLRLDLQKHSKEFPEMKERYKD
jgi:hypothetical protein